MYELQNKGFLLYKIKKITLQIKTVSAGCIDNPRTIAIINLLCAYAEILPGFSDNSKKYPQQLF